MSKRTPKPKPGSERRDSPLDVVKLVLDGADIPAERLENAEGFRVTLRDKRGEATTGFAHVFDEARTFMFRLVFRRKAPKSKIAVATEFITRANDGMFVGNFELNLDDGEIKFKTYVDYRSTRLQSVYVRNAVLAAMEIFEGYADALNAVLQGKMTVTNAIKSVEE